MMHIRFSCFLVGLFLSLVALGDSFALAANRGILIPDNKESVYKNGHQEFRARVATPDASKSNWVRGRKMSAKEMKEVKTTPHTGKAMNSPNKSFGSSNAKESIITTFKSRTLTTVNKKIRGSALEPLNLSNTPQGKSQEHKSTSSNASLGSQKGSKLSATTGSHDKIWTNGTQKLLEATAEIFKMLHKDYHSIPRRRPPINNDVPLKDINVKP